MTPLATAARVARLRPTAVNRVLQEVRQLESQGRSLVSLMRGQPNTPTPPHIVEAATRSLRDGRSGYPNNQGEPALREAVALALRREPGLVYDPESEILITDGATLGIHAALGALLEPQGPVLLPDPIYDAYDAVIQLWGGRPVPVRTQLDNGRFTIRKGDCAEARGTGKPILLLNTPWNPVGTVLSRGELTELVDFAAEAGAPVLSDEIYHTLVYDEHRHVSPAAVSTEARERTIVINSLSKTYSMTGWRVGYCAAPQPIIRAMLLVLQQSSRGPATFVQDAAACALVSDQACVRRMTTEYQARRDQVVERLRGIPGVEPIVPEGGLFVMVDVRGLNRPSDEIRRFLLLESGVVVLHGAAYGPGGEGTLRVSFAAGGEVLEHGLERLRSGLERLAAERPVEVNSSADLRN
jgi:aspartate/methionine/tyrosine aminotransferase